MMKGFPILAFAIALLLSSCGRKAAPPVDNPEAGAVSGADAATPVSLPAKVSFNQHIQPILSEYCYHCHGPDSGTREPKDAPLRLDLAEQAFAPRDNGKPVIVKGKPAESEIIKRMRSHDPDMIMPPPRSHKEMDEASISLMERWIEQGAEYQPHWSFIPVKRPEVPGAGKGWAANPIDRFVAAKLDEAGLTPNPPEDPRRFFRRLHLDLTGLPPAPEEVDRFVKESQADPSKAVADAADRLLASMASAEHFGRLWLDAARYGDTHGIHFDNFRSIWPYRDWVVKAFHDNMPWDRFTTEQMAGDLLPQRSEDQLIATGFNRCLATTGEAGAIPEEYEAIYAKDRVETVSALWLGLTTGCAACHDHKFDPVSTKEFYSLTAFFRNSTMEALDGNKKDHPPYLVIPREEDRARWEELNKEIPLKEAEVAAYRKNTEKDLQSWLPKAKPGLPAVVDPLLSLRMPLTEDSGPLKGMLDGKPRVWEASLPRTQGIWGKAPVFGNNGVDLGDVAGFGPQDNASFGMFVRIDDKFSGTIASRTGGDPEKEVGWVMEIRERNFIVRILHPANQTNRSLRVRTPLTPGRWHHLMFTYLATTELDSPLRLFLDGAPLLVLPVNEDPPPAKGGSGRLRLGPMEGADPVTGTFAVEDIRFYRRTLDAGFHGTPVKPLLLETTKITNTRELPAIARTPHAKRTKDQIEILRDYYLTSVNRHHAEMAGQLSALRAERAAIRERGKVTLIMDEKETEPFAHVLVRGVYSSKGERVTPDTPKVLPPIPADAPKNRLGLARWLNDPANPLPARVTMNRLWHQIFGTGIVESNEDFGIMGSRPTHPELLDWLAAEFMESKWNHRHMVKLLVTSAAYRQSAKVTPEKLEKDPANRLLARGPRVRLDAEPIRDLALAASGLLSTKVGGPPVKPYQPEGIWESVAMPQSNTQFYQTGSGDALYRRSMYSLWKRTAPPATMEIFNAPSREVSCVRRDRTNTPLQALALMNDPQFVEASRELAARAMESSPDPAARIDFMTQRLLSRMTSEEERKVMLESLDAIRDLYRSSPDKASQLIRTGETPPPPGLDPAELAAWTMVASQLLNLDETVTR